MNGQFLVARYLADLERQEPKNIGIIVWTKGKTALRFLDPDDADFVEDTDNYRRWVAYWQELCAQKRLQLFNDPVVTLGSSRWIHAIRKTQQGNYTLDIGGHILEEVNAQSVEEAARFLFSRIVSPIRDISRDREPGLTERCLDVLKVAGITNQEGFQRRFPVPLNDFENAIHFDFGTGRGKPRRLYNRVNLSKEDSVTLAAGKCATAIQYASCNREMCFSLFDSEEDTNVGAIKFLSTCSVPLDISDPETPAELRRAA